MTRRVILGDPRVVVPVGVAVVAWALVIATLVWPQGGASSAPQGSAAEGQALFVAKGCATCHQHAAITGVQSYGVGPTLTGYQGNPDAPRRWLRDPGAVKPGTQMPNLHLSDAEIESLVAFLLQE